MQTQAEAAKLGGEAFVAGVIAYSSPPSHASAFLMKPSSLLDYTNEEE